ncbi:MAG: 6-carboxytetrahydropterin synthase [Acidobacteriaceae bacterium]
MRVEFTRRYRLSASHRLHYDGYSEEENRAVYGKCNNPHGHGHNYVVEVTVSGAVNGETGMVMNMVDLDALVREEVIARFHLQNLNMDALFADEVPTTENLCRAVYRLLDGRAAPARLRRVRIEETSNNFFEYAGEDAGEMKRG